MEFFSIKTLTVCAVVILILSIIALFVIKYFIPRFYFYYEGFQNVDCIGITCPEGKFCQSNKCVDIATRYPNAVPAGDE
jgi:hypothetical protein